MKFITQLLIVSAFFSLCILGDAKAQNIQLYYDMGSLTGKESLQEHPSVRATFELFKPDKYGSTFVLVDANMMETGTNQAFLEVVRSLRFWDSPLHIHLEYNGGLAANHPIPHMGYLGLSYLFTNPEHSKSLSLAASYKYIHQGAIQNSFQLAAYWNLNYSDNLFTLMGFAKYWREERGYAQDMMLFSNQFWMNLNAFDRVSDDFKFSVGGKLELAHNHYGDGFACVPLVGVKWSF